MLALPPQAPRPWAAGLYVPGSIIFMLFLMWKKLETLNLSKLVGSYGTQNACGSEPGTSWATQLLGRRRQQQPAGPGLRERPRGRQGQASQLHAFSPLTANQQPQL